MDTLAKILGDAIAEKAETEAERTALIRRMAEAAGIEPTTVNQILRGEIETPPEERLKGFAEVLEMPLERLQRAAPQPDRRTSTALAAAMPLPAPGQEGDAPDWIHILPAGRIETRDGRGPYRLEDVEAVLAASINDERGIAIDENHATDLAGRAGQSAPAMGWVEELQMRPNGIWARVAWNRQGRALVADRAYRHVSPVFAHDEQGRVRQILRVSLVNIPNLRGLTALNMETDMDLLARLIELLGLDAAATEAQVIEAVDKMRQPAANAEALNATLAEVASALGVENVEAATVLAAARAASRAPDAIVALQAELTTVADELNTLRDTQARRAAEAFVDGAIREGRAGVKPLRDHYIAMHMADPARVEKELGVMPRLTGTALDRQPRDVDGVSLSAEQLTVARMLGQKPEDYAATLKAERADEEAN